MVWLFWDSYPVYKDKSFIYVGYLFLTFLLIFLSVETDIGALIFGNLTSGFRALGTIFILLGIIGAGGYLSLSYYSKNSNAKQAFSSGVSHPPMNRSVKDRGPSKRKRSRTK